MTPQEKLRASLSGKSTEVTSVPEPAKPVPQINTLTQALSGRSNPERPVETSTLGMAVEFISRPQYASAKFADATINDGKGIFDALADSIGELFDPKEKLSYSDVIKKRAPEFARDNPTATKVLGYLGDIAFDPTTYLGVGIAGQGFRVGRKVLTGLGKEAVTRQIAKLEGREILTVAGGLYKDVEVEIAKAARKGITATAQPITKKIGKQQVTQIAQDFADELTAVGVNPNEMLNLAKGLTSKNRATKLALDELNRMIEDVSGYQGVIRKLAPEEVRELAEQRIIRITEQIPELASKYFVQDKKISLKLGLPFGKQFDIPYLQLGLDPIKRRFDALGVLRDMVVGKEIPVISKGLELTTKTIPNIVKRTFVRPQDEPFRTVIEEYQNNVGVVASDINREAKRLFKLPEDRRKLMTQTLSEIDDKTRIIEFTQNRTVTQAEADTIFSDILAKTKLTPEELGIVAKMKQSYSDVAAMEIEADLLKTELLNYYPRYYQALNNPTEVTSFIQNKYGLSNYLPSAQQRTFTTLKEAEAAGLVPELDAAMIWGTRMLMSRRALVKNQLFKSLEGIYGVTINVQDDLKKLPPHIVDDLRLLGESVYPMSMNSTVKQVVQGMNYMTGIYKKLVTVVKPSFAPKQLTSNAFQVALTAGILPAMKIFDPRSGADAAMLFFDFYRGAKTTTLPQFVTNLFGKFSKGGGQGSDAVLASRLALENVIGEERVLDYAKEFNLVTAFGQTISGPDLLRIMRENGVIRGFDATGEQFTKGLKQHLEFDPNNKWDVTKELAQWWKYPSMVEDYSRAVTFINGMRIGMNPAEAAQMVNKALYDYGRGLTFIEQRYMKTLIPFYSFQRFAIPRMLQVAASQPGNIATGQKFVQLFEKLLLPDKEQLNPSEQEIFGDSLLVEQPRVFRGFDKNGLANFNILANMTPLDALSLFVYDKDDNLDIRRTVEKSILAALTPFIKVPVESILDKNFFTGKPISEGGNLGNLKGSNADYVLSKALPEFVKESIGWENRTNTTTGKSRTYINPYLAYYMMTPFPLLKQFIRGFDQDKTSLDAAMEIITGIVPAKVDLKEQRQWQMIAENKRVQDIRKALYVDKLRGSMNQYEEDYKTYLDIINSVKEGRAKKLADTVRGIGIVPQQTTEVTSVEQEQR